MVVLRMAVSLAGRSFDLGIVTTNPDQMVEFYRDVLGFTRLTICRRGRKAVRRSGSCNVATLS